MHLLSIKPADMPKLHDIFKAGDAHSSQHQFPVSACEFTIIALEKTALVLKS